MSELGRVAVDLAAREYFTRKAISRRRTTESLIRRRLPNNAIPFAVIRSARPSNIHYGNTLAFTVENTRPSVIVITRKKTRPDLFGDCRVIISKISCTKTYIYIHAYYPLTSWRRRATETRRSPGAVKSYEIRLFLG